MDIKKLEKKYQKSFNKTLWYDRYIKSKNKRSSWDDDYVELSQIRDNKFTKRDGIMEDISDIVISDNPLQKAIKYKDALITGGNFFIDLRHIDGIPTPEQIALEAEINFIISQQQLQSEISLAKEDHSWYGLGCVRHDWNSHRISNIWKTGTPESHYVDCRRIFIDPATIRNDFKDINYLFHVETYTVEDIERIFNVPDGNIFIEANDVSLGETYENSEGDSHVHVIIGEFKTIVLNKKCIIKDLETGVENIVDIDSEDDFNKILEYKQRADRIDVSEPFDAEEECVFTFALARTDGTVLLKPTYVGKSFSYSFINGERLSNDCYPRGLAYFLKDIQIAQTILYTVLVTLTTRSTKRNIATHDGSLVNAESFFENRHKLDAEPAIIDEGWSLSHPGINPIQFLDENINPFPIQNLMSMLGQTIKTTSGATDPIIGQSSPSDSGVKLAQLQSAAGIYHKSDESAYHSFIVRIGNWFKDSIPIHRNYPHDIIISGESSEGFPDGEKMAYEVKGSSFHVDEYVCDATITNSSEVEKQQKINLSMQLYQMGVLSPLHLLADMDIPNPEKVYDEALQAQGLKEAVTILKENPDLLNYVVEFKNQQKAIGNQGSAGKDVSNLKEKQKKGND